MWTIHWLIIINLSKTLTIIFLRYSYSSYNLSLFFVNYRKQCSTSLHVGFTEQISLIVVVVVVLFIIDDFCFVQFFFLFCSPLLLVILPLSLYFLFLFLFFDDYSQSTRYTIQKTYYIHSAIINHTLISLLKIAETFFVFVFILRKAN